MLASHEVLRKSRLASGWHWWESRVTQEEPNFGWIHRKSTGDAIPDPMASPDQALWDVRSKSRGTSNWACSFPPFFPGRGRKGGG